VEGRKEGRKEGKKEGRKEGKERKKKRENYHSQETLSIVFLEVIGFHVEENVFYLSSKCLLSVVPPLPNIIQFTPHYLLRRPHFLQCSAVPSLS
jgi:hypothetical protein